MFNKANIGGIMFIDGQTPSIDIKNFISENSVFQSSLFLKSDFLFYGEMFASSVKSLIISD